MQIEEVATFQTLDWVLQREGFIIFIGGAKERGKTDFALLIAEYCLEKEFRSLIATNINAQTPDYAIRQITNMPDLKKWLQKGGRKLFILDEAGMHLSKMRFMTKKNVEILNVLQTIRHYQCGFIGIAPSENYAIGFDITIYDDDDGGVTENQIRWRSTVQTGSYTTEDTSLFGDIVLKSSQYHRSDINQNCIIELQELFAFIDRWKISIHDVPMSEMMEAIGFWKAGTGC